MYECVAKPIGRHMHPMSWGAEQTLHTCSLALANTPKRYHAHKMLLVVSMSRAATRQCLLAPHLPSHPEPARLNLTQQSFNFEILMSTRVVQV
jgi:hypothetical protein